MRKPDGTVVVTPDSNVQDMPAEVTRSAPMYSDVHEKHVAVKALGIGDVLEYAVRYRTVKPQVPGQFWYEYNFYKRHIAKDEELEISVPRDKYVKVESPDYKPEIKDEGARRIYTWKTSNLIVKNREDMLNAREAPAPSVQVTTFRDWAEVGSWYEQLQRPQMAVTPQIQAKAAKLTKGLATDEDKIRAIYNYVSTGFHYVSLSFGIGRYQPHAAEDVLENEYGDCKDKHTLLATLLKAAGFDAWPALINSSRKIDPAVPSPGQFDHVITAVPRGTSIIWLDTTPEVSPFRFLTANLRDRKALVIPTTMPASLMETESQPPFPLLQTFNADGALSADGTLTAKVQQTARGDIEVMYRMAFRGIPPAQWKELGQRISYGEGFSGEVSDLTASAPDQTDKPFQFSYDYSKKSFGDWDSHRIVAPLPWFGIESSALDEKPPAEPLVLASLGELVYKSKTVLPAGLAPAYSEKMDLSEDFADYHASYVIANGALIADRRLVIKKSEVPLAEWEKYKKFRKALAEERDRFIDLDNGTTQYPPGEKPRQAEGAVAATTNPAKDGLDATSSGAASKLSPQDVAAEAARDNPQAAKYMQQGAQAVDGRDFTQAEESFRKVIELDPKYPGVHAGLGWVYMSQRNLEGTLKELRLEIEYHPELPGTYPMLAQVLTATQHKDEAIEVYRKWLKVDPSNRDAALRLSRMLSDSKKNAEAIAVLENAIKLSPDSPSLQSALGSAYLDNKQTDKGIALLEQTLGSDAKPMEFNDAAYILADQNVHLDKAKDWGDKALQSLEAGSLKTQTEEGALKSTRDLGATWDTVGWIYFRMGEFEKAEAYLNAAFRLTQNAVVGDHLAQTYAKQGKKQQAAHTYRLAYAAAKGSDKNDIKQHYQELMGKSADPEEAPVTLKRGARDFGPEDELSRSRTHKLSNAAHSSGSATFSVVFSPGKIDDVKFVSGDEKLKPMASEIASSKMRADFPNSDAVRLTRRGVLVCGSVGCDFTLLLPDSARATE